jgi:hypothetical protein
MPSAGTFEYVSSVPPEGERDGEWRVQLTKPVTLRGNRLGDSRLVGHEPVLAIAACEPALRPGSRRTQLPQCRFTLKASSRTHATVSAASFYVDQRMLSVFQTGDSFHMSRTACAGRGLSLLRKGRLVFALGAITSVPLGNIQAHTPHDLVMEAEQVFKRHDAEFAFREFPVQIEVGGEMRLMYRGLRTMNGYEVSVMHGFYPGIPGENECAAITLRNACRHSIASITAQFFDSTEIEIEQHPVGQELEGS